MLFFVLELFMSTTTGIFISDLSKYKFERSEFYLTWGLDYYVGLKQWLSRSLDLCPVDGN